MQMMKKTLSAALATLAGLAALTMAAPVPASAAAVTIRVERAYAETVREWIDPFTCPTNMVLTGRSHYGDENAPTTYYCGFVFVNDEQARVYIGDWTSGQKESRSSYTAPADQALAGRWHTGDENGTTRYRTATIHWQGGQVRLTDSGWSGEHKESNHNWQAEPAKVMIGRWHTGDENGKTKYQYATVTVTG